MTKAQAYKLHEKKTIQLQIQQQKTPNSMNIDYTWNLNVVKQHSSYRKL